MARKETTFTATYGRDAHKQYKLTEMTASQGEWWAERAMLGIGKGGDVPIDAVDIALISASGMEGFAMAATTGFRALLKMPPVELKPLMEEMWQCVQFLPETKMPRPLLEEDIEEVQTRLQIRDEVIKLHTGFSIAERFQTWGLSAKTMLETMQNIQASRGQSAPLSAPDAPPSAS